MADFDCIFGLDDSFDSDEDELLFLDYLEYAYPRRQQRQRKDPFNDMDDEQFFARFRLRKSTVLLLLAEIENQLQFQTKKNNPVSPINQLLVTLRFYAAGTFQLILADLFGLDQSTVSRIIHKVTRLIASLGAKHIEFPTDELEKRRAAQQFYDATGFPGVVGALGCTHVPIQGQAVVGSGESSETFRNRRGYYSVNVQLVCDHRMYFTDIVARWPGATHDSMIFDLCRLKARLESNEIGGRLVGSEAYVSRKYLLTPIGRPATGAERAYNEAQRLCRGSIDKANDALKNRFQALKYGMRVNLDNTLPAIVAMVVCHNIAISVGEDDPPVDEELEEFLKKRRLNGEQLDFESVPVQPFHEDMGSGQDDDPRTAIVNEFFADKKQ